MKLLYDRRLRQRLSTAVRRTSSKDWRNASARRRGQFQQQLNRILQLHGLTPLVIGFVLGALTLNPQITPDALAGFLSVAMLAAALPLVTALRQALNPGVPWDFIGLLPVPESFSTALKAACIRPKLFGLLAGTVICFALGIFFAAAVRHGATVEAAGKSLVAGCLCAGPVLTMACLMVALPAGRFRFLLLFLKMTAGLLCLAHFYFLLSLKFKVPLPLGLAEQAAGFLPQGALLSWVGGGGFPVRAALICLAAGLASLPAWRYWLFPEIPRNIPEDEPSAPEPLYAAAELVAEAALRERRREAFLSPVADFEEEPADETDDAVDWSEDDPLLFHPDAPRIVPAAMPSRFREAIKTRTRALLDSPGTGSLSGFLIRPLPDWRYSLKHMKPYLIYGVGGILIASIFYTGPLPGAAAVLAILCTLLPFLALTPFKIEGQPAFDLFTPAPGQAVPLFGWLPIHHRALVKLISAGERRSLGTGLLFSVAFAFCLWLGALLVADTAEWTGLELSPVLSALSAPMGPLSSAQLGAGMAGVLWLARSIYPVGLSKALLKPMPINGLWGLATILLALLCLISIISAVVCAIIIGAVAGGYWQKPFTLQVFLAILAIGEISRWLAVEWTLLCCRRAKAEYRTNP